MCGTSTCWTGPTRWRWLACDHPRTVRGAGRAGLHEPGLPRGAPPSEPAAVVWLTARLGNDVSHREAEAAYRVRRHRPAAEPGPAHRPSAYGLGRGSAGRRLAAASFPGGGAGAPTGAATVCSWPLGNVSTNGTAGACAAALGPRPPWWWCCRASSWPDAARTIASKQLRTGSPHPSSAQPMDRPPTQW